MFRTMYDLAKVVGPCQTNYYVLIRQIRKVTVRSVFRALDQEINRFYSKSEPYHTPTHSRYNKQKVGSGPPENLHTAAEQHSSSSSRAAADWQSREQHRERERAEKKRKITKLPLLRVVVESSFGGSQIPDPRIKYSTGTIQV